MCDSVCLEVRNKQARTHVSGDKYTYLLNYDPDPEAISNFHDCSAG